MQELTHPYIQKTIKELEAECEPSPMIEWVKTILTEMNHIATNEANASNQVVINELKERISSSLEIADDLMGDIATYKVGELLEKRLKGI